MTKKQATDIKKAIKGLYERVYYDSKKEELRVIVCSGEHMKKFPTGAAVAILNSVSNAGMRPRFRKESKVYQGFVDFHYIVFM